MKQNVESSALGPHFAPDICTTANPLCARVLEASENLPFLHHRSDLMKKWPLNLRQFGFEQPPNASSFGAGAAWSGASQAGYAASSSVMFWVTEIVFGSVAASITGAASGILNGLDTVTLSGLRLFAVGNGSVPVSSPRRCAAS